VSWDKESAVSYLRWHAESTSHGRCARYVREAIERGGVPIIRTYSAKDYGDSLKHAGFQEVSGFPERGDVIVIQSIDGHPDGHMAMFDGEQWISDFKQPSGFYPSRAYRVVQPPYKMYRRR
jgi:hypothetical protein